MLNLKQVFISRKDYMENNPITNPAPEPEPAPVAPDPGLAASSEPSTPPVQDPVVPPSEPVASIAEPITSTAEPITTASDSVTSTAEAIAPVPETIEPTIPNPITPSTDPATSSTTESSPIIADPIMSNPASTVTAQESTPPVSDPVVPSSTFGSMQEPNSQTVVSTAPSLTNDSTQNQLNAAPTMPSDKPAKKGLSGKLIGLIIGIAVLVLGGGAFLLLTLLSGNPTKLVNEAFLNVFSKDSIGYKASMEAPMGTESISFSIESFQDKDNVYIKIDGFKSIIGALLGIFSSDASILDSYTETIEKIEGTWWKADADSSSSIGAGMFSAGIADREKKLAAFKQSPFFVAEKQTGNIAYSTSGTAYNVTIDEEKAKAYSEALGSDSGSSGLSIGSLSLDDSDSSNKSIVVTVSKPLFGQAKLTGIYATSGEGDEKQTIIIDFEHCVQSAPADAKDASELEGLMAGGTGGTGGNSSQRDVERRKDYSTLSANITSYMTNNNGNLPDNGQLDPTRFINVSGEDPEGNTYVLEVIDYAAGDYPSVYVGFSDTYVYVVKHASCDGDYIKMNESNYSFVVYGALEDDPYTFCLSSN